MRPAQTFVGEIGSELALPLARAYCDLHHLKFSWEAGEDTWWAGAFVHGALRGTLGLSLLPELNNAMLVSGVFTDASDDAYLASKMLVERLTQIPCELYGSLHLPTERERRQFRRNGFTLFQGVMG